LFPVLEDGLDSFATVLEEIASGAKRRQPLQVTTTNAFAHRWLVPRLPLWRETNPDIALEIIGTDTVVDLNARQADIAIRYQRCPPTALVTHELFRDTFWPVCSPALIAAAPISDIADIAQHTLIHMHWQPWERAPPTWQRWLEAARDLDPQLQSPAGVGALSFREELHAIEAVIDGQGIGILSDALVARELASGALVKALDLSLPGFGFYFAHLPNHPKQAVIDAFHAWICSVA
jgi:LysR family glycine cleavage system transcriptional activator